MIGEGPAARSIKLDLPPFTLVGATTRAGLLTSPLRDRFGIVQRLEFYTVDELASIVMRSAKVLGITMEQKGAYEIARRSRGTPRIANRLLRRVRDYAEVKGNGAITEELAIQALDMLKVDSNGFDALDRKLLMTMIENFAGGPVGLDTLAAAISEERGTIEDVLEPYLLQQGFIMRTPRGRVVTQNAYLHFGLQPPQLAETLMWGAGVRSDSALTYHENKKFIWPIRVYYEDTDAGGVVFYANYLKFFERARTEMLRAMGYEQDQLIVNEGIIFVVRSVQVDYLSPARFNELLQVSAEVTLAKKASLTFEQLITRGDDVLCKSIIRIACLDAAHHAS